MALNQFADAGIIERYNRSIDPDEFDFVGKARARQKQQQDLDIGNLRLLAEQDALRQAREEQDAYAMGAEDDALPRLKKKGTKAASTLAGKMESDLAAQAKRDSAKADDDEKRQRDSYEYHLAGVTRFQAPEDIRQHLADGVLKGAYSMQEAQAMMKSAPKTAEEIPAWRDSLLRSTMSAKDQVSIGSREAVAASTVDQRADAAKQRHDEAMARLEQQKLQAQTAAEFKAAQLAIQREALNFRREQAADKRQGGGNVPDQKPMPASALKMQQEDLDVIGGLASSNADLEVLTKQIDDGQIQLGPIRNLVSRARNAAGMSDSASQNFATLKASLEKQRNTSLLLNKGVQTEGDAQRAWNELFENMNDPKVVSKRLKEIKAINERAVELKKRNVELLRDNYGRGNVDMTQTTNVKPSVQAGPVRVNSPDDARKLAPGTQFVTPDGRTFTR